MNATMMIHQARMEGLALSLSPSGKIKLLGEAVAVNRWLPRIRENKSDLVVALREDENETNSDAVSWGWLIHFANGPSIDVYYTPEVTRADILAAYPDAVATVPLGDTKASWG